MSYPATVILHASTVAIKSRTGWRALVIQGAAGSGKSGLSLSLMALGARLVADDRTQITRQGTSLLAAAPASIAGLIEARGIGLLTVPALASAPVRAVLSLDHAETERLPPRRHTEILGLRRPLLHNSASQHFAAALLHYLLHGRKD